MKYLAKDRNLTLVQQGEELLLQLVEEYKEAQKVSNNI
jgi:hypothetical protein